ncbi:hypothetical protein [Bradyrhizobium sp. USDA 4473]
MKLVKTIVIAGGISAFLAYPIIAQSLAADAKARKGVQGTSLQSDMSDDEDPSPKLRASGLRMGRKSTKGAKSAAGGNPQDEDTPNNSPTSNTPTSGKRH